MSDDLWRLRLRRAGFHAPGPYLALPPGTCPAFVGKVISTGTNLAVGKYFKANPVDLTGAETEGGAGTPTPDTTKQVLVYALGPAAPATNDYLICRSVKYRWVAEKQSIGGGGSGPSTGFSPCCPSDPVPATISLTFTFRSGTSAATYNNQFQNTTLTYMATRPAYDPSIGGYTPAFYSGILTTSLGEQIYYRINCNAPIGTHGMGYGTAFLAGPAACFGFATQACSPYLLSGIINGGNCASAFGFGVAGDNATAS